VQRLSARGLATGLNAALPSPILIQGSRLDREQAWTGGSGGTPRGRSVTLDPVPTAPWRDHRI